MFTNRNIYLGRQEFLFSLTDLHEVAVKVAEDANMPAPTLKNFLAKVASALSRIANVEGGSPVSYIYHEPSDTHFTNFPGMLQSLTYCPPKLRVKFTEAISHAIALSTPKLDTVRRSIAVEQVRAGDVCLANEEVALQIIMDPDNTVAILEKFSEEYTRGKVETKTEETVELDNDSAEGRVPEEASS